MSAAGPVIDLRSRTAIAGWVFMALWLGALAAMTWVLHRDGPHPSQPADLQYGVIGVFWLVGIPAGLHLLAQPCTRFVVAPDGTLTIARRSLFGRETETFPPGSIAGVEVRAAKDDDGDRIFRTVVIAADGRERLAREALDEAAGEVLAARLRTALGLLAESAPAA